MSSSGKSESEPASGEQNVIVIAGGTSGIGLATACRFASAGWQVVLGGRDAGRRESAVEYVREQAGRTPLAYELDVRARDSIESLVANVAQKCARIDVWVNAAGIAPLAAVTEVSDPEFRDTFLTNCESIFYATQTLWPVFQDAGGGVIVNVSSLAATDPFPGFSVYGASKAWVNLFSQATASEGEPSGIRIFAISPGAVETPLLRSLFPDFPTDQVMPASRVAEQIWEVCQLDCAVPSGSSIEIHP